MNPDVSEGSRTHVHLTVQCDCLPFAASGLADVHGIKEPLSMAAPSISISSSLTIAAMLLFKDAGISLTRISQAWRMRSSIALNLQPHSYVLTSLDSFLLLNLTISGISTFPRLHSQLSPCLPEPVNYENHSQLLKLTSLVVLVSIPNQKDVCSSVVNRLRFSFLMFPDLCQFN